MRKIIITESQLNDYIKFTLKENWGNRKKSCPSRLEKFFTLVPELVKLKQNFNLSIFGQDEPDDEYANDLEELKSAFYEDQKLFLEYLQTGELPFGPNGENIATTDPDAVAFINLRVNNIRLMGDNKFADAIGQLNKSDAIRREGERAERKEAEKSNQQKMIDKRVADKNMRIENVMSEISKTGGSEINSICQQFGKYASDGDSVYAPCKKPKAGQNIQFPPNWVELRRALKANGYTCGAVTLQDIDKCTFATYPIDRVQ